MREIMMRKIHITKDKPKNEPRKRRMDAPDNPTSEQMAARAKSRDAAMKARSERECRSHLKGRCINGEKCTAKHTTPCSEILCNSRVPVGSVANFTNLTYGFCRLHDEAQMECPYMNCVHATQPPEDDPTMTEAEVEAAVLAHDEMQAEADAKAEKEAAEGTEAAARAEMDTGEDTSEKSPTQELR